MKIEVLWRTPPQFFLKKKSEFKLDRELNKLRPLAGASFSFLYLKKSKFQKYMSVLKNFKNTPGRPMGGDRS